MGFLSPDYIKKNPKFPPAPVYAVDPSSFFLLEPVVAEGDVVFAADKNGDLDIVLAAGQEIALNIIQV